MSAAELKQQIIDRLSNIDDVVFLEAIMTIVNSKTQHYHMSAEEIIRVEESRLEYKKGQTISQEDLDKELDEWLGTE